MSDTRFTRSGETEYASIHRNRSGASSGEIDYGWAPFFCQDNLSDGDQQALVDTCFALYETMCHHLEKQAKNDARRWRPIEEAPKDGTPFVTYIPQERNEDDPIECYDIAHWSDDCGEFIKFGCGFRYVTHWKPLEPPE